MFSPNDREYYARKFMQITDKAVSARTDAEKALLIQIRAGQEATDVLVDKKIALQETDPIPLDYTEDLYWE